MISSLSWWAGLLAAGCSLELELGLGRRLVWQLTKLQSIHCTPNIDGQGQSGKTDNSTQSSISNFSFEARPFD